MDPVVIGYSPNDFFWESVKDAKYNDDTNIITVEWCEETNKGITCKKDECNKKADTEKDNCYKD